MNTDLTAAIEAAALAIDVACDSANTDGAWRLVPDAEYYDMPGVFAQEAMTFARAAVEAAAPLIEAAKAERIARAIETTFAANARGELDRPKVERGGFLNDREWAAAIARRPETA